MRDIYVNNEVVSARNAPVLENVRHDTIKYKTHGDVDFTADGKHIQFVYALFREQNITDEQCIVDDDVRKALDYLQKNRWGKSRLYPSISGKSLKNGKYFHNLLERVVNFTKDVEPIFWKFYEEDMKKLEDQKKNQ
ncbi:MAG: hypothetical protein WCL18_00290 [bacterium]